MKKEQSQKASETKEIPFFARYLEGEGLKVKAGLKAGVTRKFPSDSDEG